jgi:hypothetical protein
MNKTIAQYRRPGRGRALISLFVVLVLAQFSPSAQGAKSKGGVEVRSAYAEIEEGVYYIRARLDYTLGSSALEALRNGVTLNIELQIYVNRVRRFIWDDTVADLRQRYQLSFHALTQRYLVANLNSGGRESFGDLSSALLHLGDVGHLPVIDQALLDQNHRYQVGLRAVVDVRELPGPLNWISRVWGNWRIVSEWYTWPLRQ